MTDRTTQSVELRDCVHCRAIVINPTSVLGTCPRCKAELYPTARIVPPNTYIDRDLTFVTPEGKEITF